MRMAEKRGQNFQIITCYVNYKHAMLIIYVHYDIARYFLTCEGRLELRGWVFLQLNTFKMQLLLISPMSPTPMPMLIAIT